MNVKPVIALRPGQLNERFGARYSPESDQHNHLLRELPLSQKISAQIVFIWSQGGLQRLAGPEFPFRYCCAPENAQTQVDDVPETGYTNINAIRAGSEDRGKAADCFFQREPSVRLISLGERPSFAVPVEAILALSAKQVIAELPRSCPSASVRNQHRVRVARPRGSQGDVNSAREQVASLELCVP